MVEFTGKKKKVVRIVVDFVYCVIISFFFGSVSCVLDLQPFYAHLTAALEFELDVP